MITKKELLELAEIHDTKCVSIFISTHRGGEETLNGKDAIKLKNQLKDVKAKLALQGWSENAIESFLKPI
ncbi:MAG TPA: hypothetical protein VFM99_00090, partial [Chitinophagales bacterium]|nr:hypothetical protein [Chitinophagales bacterium]